MAEFQGRNFQDVEVELDGNKFEDCTFTQCRLIYRGGTPPNLVGCSFDKPMMIFDGPASATLAFLTAMYQGGLSALVEPTLDNIRKGKHPEVM
ncbi:hypothetical protein HLB42_09525 [Deinococcus sp. D7000]|nr:hypothetical protein HLB42_09525 [Deinococcus sp. D7000]